MALPDKNSSSNFVLMGEFTWIFIATPLVLALEVSILIKLLMVVFALAIVIYRSFSQKIYSEAFVFDSPMPISIKKRLIFVASALFVGGSVFVYSYDKSLLFKVVREAPLLWVGILFLYTFVSVIPQEFLYRRYFFARYGNLFSSKALLILVNVFCFSFCHLFLHSEVVLVLTALGGILFALSYIDREDITWVSLEHAIYGNIIFTLGIGEMLAFPMPG